MKKMENIPQAGMLCWTLFGSNFVSEIPGQHIALCDFHLSTGTTRCCSIGMGEILLTSGVISLTENRLRVA
jgi:hypothetical protein